MRENVILSSIGIEGIKIYVNDNNLLCWRCDSILIQ